MDVQMALPRVLASPPIVEALVDVRVPVTAPPETFEALSRELHSVFPKTHIRRAIKAELRVDHGKLIPPTAQELGFQGVLLQNDDDSLLVQFTPDGFTFNNLKKYMGGDALLTEALRLWSSFAQHLQPTADTRVALRYVNQLRLPFRTGDEFSKYLTAAPPTPDGAPQTVSEFLSRVVAHDEGLPATVITTLQLITPEPGLPRIVIDVDAFCEGQFSADAGELRPVLDGLRDLKNRTFFAHQTDEAVQLFV
jgi:uncharacterized protein (TIGR04255 family)